MDRLVSHSRASAVVTVLVLTLAAGCAGDRSEGGGGGTTTDSADRRDSAAASARDSTPAARIATIAADFKTPESVRYDGPADLYFVSNINGNPSQKDNNGFIATVKPDSTAMTILVQGGQNGVTLHAPKGMMIVGDTLWVADIDAVRGFNKRTGAAVRSIDLAPQQALFLNDLATGSDGAMYITDTGIRFSATGTMSAPAGAGKVIRIAPDGTPTVVLRGDELGRPNGITWDGGNGRFIIVPFNAATVFTWKPGDRTTTTLTSGPGQFDGVEILGDGRILVTSWADSSVHVIAEGKMSKMISGVAAPADLGYDTRRNRVLVPLFNGNTVEVWSAGR
jgi:sugar lactone lactonase YvrE